MESFVNGALKRARENGRTLPLDYFLNTHMGAPKVLINVAKRFRGDPRVEITVIDGNRGIGNAVIADIKFLERVVQKYNREELRKALFRALEDAHKKGKRGKDGGISESFIGPLMTLCLRKRRTLLAQSRVRTYSSQTEYQWQRGN